ncbi:MAG: histidine phosphatase family protein [Flavobacteriales bacterium]|nr:histidine phosphatase family protein [Flavobacteriales bacterium]
MKTLFLVRHAKSSRDNPKLTDFERPLNERGMRDAPFMAARFAAEHPDAQLIVSSPANRALTTARYFQKALQLKDERFRTDEKIYDASLMQLLNVVNHLPDGLDNMMMFGHNPGFSQLATYLNNEIIEMPTCSIVHIEMDITSWKEAGEGAGTLVSFDYPKNHFPK